MQSRKLGDISKRSPSLAPLIKGLAEYISWLEQKHVDEIIPRVAAAKLGISEADTLGILSLFQEAGMVRPRYDVVCTNSKSVLASFYSLKQIPDEVDCNLCGTSHDADDLRVELVFEIVDGRAASAVA